MMDEMAEKLDFPFRRNGAMVVCQSKEEMAVLEELMERGKKNGVEGMEMLSRSQALLLEPNLADTVYAAIHIPSSGIVCPFEMNLAYAENAVQNGVQFHLETEVKQIEKMENGFRVLTDKGMFETRFLINAAGVYADIFHNMVSREKIHITPRRGEYCLLDKNAGNLVERTIFQIPTPKGKGVLVTPTVHGNLLIGPTAADITDKEGTETTSDGLEEVMKKCTKSVKNIPKWEIITSFAGLRAHEDDGDFIIQEVKDAKGFIDVAGIESPGLSSVPAIGVYVRDIMTGLTELHEKKEFCEHRKRITRISELSREEQNGLIQENPAYGQIVCRCEGVTMGEILDAIHRPLGATTLDGIKRRTRAGMGRCQAGFCTPKNMELLAEELHLELKDIRKTGRRDAR